MFPRNPWFSVGIRDCLGTLIFCRNPWFSVGIPDFLWDAQKALFYKGFWAGPRRSFWGFPSPGLRTTRCGEGFSRFRRESRLWGWILKVRGRFLMVWECFSMVRCWFLFESFDFASFSLCFISLLGRGPNLDISIEFLDIFQESLIFSWNPWFFLGCAKGFVL